MAETQAQNKLGELFVDLGVGGLGQTLKALNSVSASFLLTKNAATQAIKPIVDMSRQGGNLVTALDKINAVTGITAEKLQGIRNWSKLNNVSFESLVGSIENVQQALMDIRLGKGLNKGFQLLGIEAWQLDPTKPLQALDLIQSKLKQVNEVTGATALRELGMNQDLAYTFKQAGKPLSQAIDEAGLMELTEQEIERLRKQQEAWNKFDIQLENSKTKLISNVDAVSTGLNYLSDNIEPLTKGMVDGLNWYTKKIADFGKWIGNLKGNYGGNQVNYNSVQQYEEITGKVNALLEEEEKKYREKQKGKDTATAYPSIINNTTTNNTLETKPINNTVASAVGAKSINNDILPTLPNVEPSNYTTNNNSRSINYNPTINMQFEIMGDGSAEQAQEIQQAIISQQELTFSELLNMAGT